MSTVVVLLSVVPLRPPPYSLTLSHKRACNAPVHYMCDVLFDVCSYLYLSPPHLTLTPHHTASPHLTLTLTSPRPPSPLGLSSHPDPGPRMIRQGEDSAFGFFAHVSPFPITPIHWGWNIVHDGYEFRSQAERGLCTQ